MGTGRKNGKAKHRAYESIKGMIMSSVLRPGQAVTEIALSTRLGISRTPIREALHDLEQEGLIVTRNRRKRIYMLTVHEIEEIFEIKIEIEGAVARWAAKQGTSPQIEKLKKISEDMRRVSGSRPASEEKESKWLSRWLTVDEKLHALLFDMAGNTRAQQIIATLNSQWHQLKFGMLTLEGRVEKSTLEHERIVQAVCARQPAQAQKQMRVHLGNLERELIKIMKLMHYPLE